MNFTLGGGGAREARGDGLLHHAALAGADLPALRQGPGGGGRGPGRECVLDKLIEAAAAPAVLELICMTRVLKPVFESNLKTLV